MSEVPVDKLLVQLQNHRYCSQYIHIFLTIPLLIEAYLKSGYFLAISIAIQRKTKWKPRGLWRDLCLGEGSQQLGPALSRGEVTTRGGCQGPAPAVPLGLVTQGQNTNARSWIPSLWSTHFMAWSPGRLPALLFYDTRIGRVCACMYVHKKLKDWCRGHSDLPCNYKPTHFMLCRLVGVLGFCGGVMTGPWQCQVLVLLPGSWVLNRSIQRY